MKKIKRSATFEVGVATVVLLITAILVATPPAMEMADVAASPSTNRSGTVAVTNPGLIDNER